MPPPPSKPSSKDSKVREAILFARRVGRSGQVPGNEAKPSGPAAQSSWCLALALVVAAVAVAYNFIIPPPLRYGRVLRHPLPSNNSKVPVVINRLSLPQDVLDYLKNTSILKDPPSSLGPIQTDSSNPGYQLYQKEFHTLWNTSRTVGEFEAAPPEFRAFFNAWRTANQNITQWLGAEIDNVYQKYENTDVMGKVMAHYFRHRGRGGSPIFGHFTVQRHSGRAKRVATPPQFADMTGLFSVAFTLSGTPTLKTWVARSADEDMAQKSLVTGPTDGFLYQPALMASGFEFPDDEQADVIMASFLWDDDANMLKAFSDFSAPMPTATAHKARLTLFETVANCIKNSAWKMPSLEEVKKMEVNLWKQKEHEDRKEQKERERKAREEKERQEREERERKEREEKQRQEREERERKEREEKERQEREERERKEREKERQEREERERKEREEKERQEREERERTEREQKERQEREERERKEREEKERKEREERERKEREERERKEREEKERLEREEREKREREENEKREREEREKKEREEREKKEREERETREREERERQEREEREKQEREEREKQEKEETAQQA